ncbi:GNAT family N-acetyltransferase [Parendozoicomonas haliclonae]|uniref:Acetyltransferase n=1 Tax=Parendozoicomonas haliclonae TaxID=1960125 RepID=A0A1X7AQ40_9GAMM|nr:GNAT family N-acetyltransferase [Parendozoicomonas haliclonae]SMA50220.1 acetyltransferase [Parendozoicomonas haliclonae]
MRFPIKEIEQADDSAICKIIKNVGAEFGAVGDGFGPSDAEVLAMSQHYHKSSRSVYLVAKLKDKIVGGCGIAPFDDTGTVCELKKLFLLPESRGLGIGRELTQQCLAFAAEAGFKECYLDTLQNMTAAIALYKKLGFTQLDQPLPGTEHNGCDVWMLKRL